METKVNEEIKGLEEKMSKVYENISNQLTNQKDKFETMKKKKMEKLHSPNSSRIILINVYIYFSKNKKLSCKE